MAKTRYSRSPGAELIFEAVFLPLNAPDISSKPDAGRISEVPQDIERA